MQTRQVENPVGVENAGAAREQQEEKEVVAEGGGGGVVILKTAIILATLRYHVPTPPQFAAKPAARKEITVTLEDKELWEEFDRQVNEMIITKTGRCLFPTLKIKVAGLEERQSYAIGMDLVGCGTGKLKYRGHKRGWYDAASGNPTKNLLFDHDVREAVKCVKMKEIYEHPDSSNTGAIWNAGIVSFGKVKLTNRFLAHYQANSEEERIFFNREGLFSLHSFHRYVPRIHILPMTQMRNFRSSSFEEWSQSGVFTFILKECSFVAVTHYQNSAVNMLKKNYNPHAKGFKETFLGYDFESLPTSEFSSFPSEEVLEQSYKWQDEQAGGRQRSGLIESSDDSQ